MADFVLERTRQAELQPLVVNGVPVVQTFRQVRAELKKRFSDDDHVWLFAEPNIDLRNGDIEWYAPVGGAISRLQDLQGAPRAEAERRLAKLIIDIADHIEVLGRSSQPADRVMANNLALAIEIPSTEHVFVVGDQPVIAGWGHVPRGPAAPKQILQSLARAVRAKEMRAASPPGPVPPVPSPPQPPGQAPVPPPPQPPVLTSVPVVAERFSWASFLLWLLFVLLLLAIAYLLLKNCAIALPGSGGDLRRALFNYCEAPVFERRAELQDRLQDLTRRLEDKQRSCRVQTPPPVGQKDVIERGGKIGAVNVILSWNTDDDLDLHVVCPERAGEIHYNNKKACGGEQDVDQNNSDSSTVRNPVENIVWLDGAAKPGEYTVKVNRFKSRSSGTLPTDFRVQLLIDGKVVDDKSGRAAGDKQLQEVMKFKLPYVKP